MTSVKSTRAEQPGPGWVNPAATCSRHSEEDLQAPSAATGVLADVVAPSRCHPRAG